MRIELSEDYKRYAKNFQDHEGLHGADLERVLDEQYPSLLPHERRYLLAVTEYSRLGSGDSRSELRALAKADFGSISLYARLFDIVEEQGDKS